jgi:putative flavoprotein involved in K+ transport
MASRTGTQESANRSALGYLEEGAAFADMAGLAPSARPNRETEQADGSSAGESPEPERTRVVVIGSGQAGLSVGYHLARYGIPFVILDANARIGDTWRARWDSLRLFTSARFDGLDGMRFPAHRNRFPTKNEMADYLEAYAARFQLPVRTGMRVSDLSRQGDRYVVTAGRSRFEAEHVVVAMGTYQVPRTPSFAGELDPRIVQLHSSAYRKPSQLQEGDVLIVGAGNSGSEIAVELARSHRIWMSGRDTGHIPFRIEGFLGRNLLAYLVLRVLFHRILTLNTPMGRKLRPKLISRGGPLVRVKPKQLEAMGVRRVGRTIGVSNGWPVLDGGRVLEIANVIWCTGFHPGFSWINIPVFDGNGRPVQTRGVVESEPGLYFVGLEFLHSPSSIMIHGVGRDARYVVDEIASRTRAAEAHFKANARVAKEHLATSA